MNREENCSKVLFLDVDGVLNDHTWNEVAKSTTIHHHCVGHFNRVILATGAAVVLSSAWRYMAENHAITLTGFEYLLRTHGAIESIRVVGTTPLDEEIRNRDDQILAWLNDHPQVQTWAAVDDGDNVTLERVRERLVLTNSGTGLDQASADKLIDLLGRKPE